MRRAFPMYLVLGALTLFGGQAVAGAVTTTRTPSAQTAAVHHPAKHATARRSHKTKRRHMSRKHRTRRVTRTMSALEMIQHRVTPAQRQAAADRAAKLGIADGPPLVRAPEALAAPALSLTAPSTDFLAAPVGLAPGTTPDYFGPVPNYANSQLPTAPKTAYSTE